MIDNRTDTWKTDVNLLNIDYKLLSTIKGYKMTQTIAIV